MACDCFILCFIVVAQVLVKASSLNTNYKWRPKADSVRLTSDSPTTLGATTTLLAQATDCGGTTFRFSFTYFDHQSLISNSNSLNYTISKWKSSGKYQVAVDIERVKPYSKYKYCGRATTTITVTDTITAYIKTLPNGDSDYDVGPVKLSANVYDPSQLFTKFTYYWDFNDGSYENHTIIAHISHNFTEVRTYYVKVYVVAMAKENSYNGTAVKTMKFKGDFKACMIIIDAGNSSSLRLPPTSSDITYVGLGKPIQFIVLYNNPYFIVKKCTAQWSLPGADNSCNLMHTFVKRGNTNVYALATMETKQGSHSQYPIRKKVFVEEPISNLSIERHNYTLLTRFVEANITCRGGAPFKMCWGLSMSNIDSDLGGNCTTLSDTCRFYINRTTIPYKGRFLLDITVLNRVGSAHLQEQFIIPDSLPPTPHSHKVEETTIGITVPLVICLITVVILIFIIRKVYTIRHRSVLETANFDFRDEDSRSLDSLYLKKSCFPSSWKFWRKSKEYYPLLENWEIQRSSSASTYSYVL